MDWSTEFNPCKYEVQREPGQDEKYDDNDQHFDDFDFRFLLHSFHLGVLCVRGDRSSPNFDPDQNVAHGYKDHGEYVAEDKVANHKIEDFTDGVWPDIKAEPHVWVIVEYYDQVEEEHPGSGDADSEDPDEDNHHSGAPLGNLAFQRPPNSQESVTKKKIIIRT